MIKKAVLFVFAALTGGIFLACENMEDTLATSAANEPEESYNTFSFDKNYSIDEYADKLQLPEFKKYEDTKTRKKKFFEFMKPVLKAENQRVIDQRNFIKKCYAAAYNLSWEISEERVTRLKKIAREYKMYDIDLQNPQTYKKLLMRVDKVPVSLALIQSANETAWGTSYFARKGNNMFGQWCFTEGCGLVPRSRPEGAKHEVAAYPSVAHSVRAYINNLNTHQAYTYFRNLRYEKRQKNEPLKGDYLAIGLQKYSSKGMEYVDIIRSMLRVNKKFLS